VGRGVVWGGVRKWQPARERLRDRNSGGSAWRDGGMGVKGGRRKGVGVDLGEKVLKEQREEKKLVRGT